MIDRTHLLARLTFQGVELTDSGLALAVAFVDALPRRALTGETLARMQAEREAFEAGIIAPGTLVTTAARLVGSAAYLPSHGRIANTPGVVVRRRTSPIPRYDVRHDKDGNEAPYDAAELIKREPVDPEAAALGAVLAQVTAEVDRANRKHGRTFPGGWGLHARAVDRETRQRTQDACDAAQGSGGASFRDVAEEEVAEVYAEAPGSAEHVRELAQVAAVYVRGMLFADFFRRVRESMGSEVQGE